MSFEMLSNILLQAQFSLLDRRPLGPNGMLQLCKERGLKLLCYGVVGGGLLTDRYLESGHGSLHGTNALHAEYFLQIMTSYDWFISIRKAK